jgi:pimeloyl-ACP methyl ester carboxylesterase
MTAITGRYLEVAGVRTYYEESGEGPLVLLIHTAGRDNGQWHGVMTECDAPARFVAPDLPGHGKSAPLSRERPCFDDIDDIAAWLSAFVTAVGGGDFIVCGCSLGGNLALLLPTIDLRIVATIPMQGADLTPTISEVGLQMMTHPQVNLSYSNMDFTMSLVGSGAEPAGREFIEWGVTTVNGPAQRGDLTAYTRTDIRLRMPEVTCPVLLVRGEHDWVVSREMVDATASRLTRAKKVELVSLPGLGHFPHVESPSAVAALLRRVLEEVSTETLP